MFVDLLLACIDNKAKESFETCVANVAKEFLENIVSIFLLKAIVFNSERSVAALGNEVFIKSCNCSNCSY